MNILSNFIKTVFISVIVQYSFIGLIIMVTRMMKPVYLTVNMTFNQ